MSVDHTRYYVLGAFALGIVLTLAYEKRSKFAEKPDQNNAPQKLKQQQKLISGLARINNLDVLKKTLEKFDLSLENGAGSIKEGIEGCIGDTPLIKIKSLSDYTGCEILAKAEVCL
jgi:cysteine synthase A